MTTEKYLQFIIDRFNLSCFNLSKYPITRVIENRVSSIEPTLITRVPGLENDIPNWHRGFANLTFLIVHFKNGGNF
jgi:hypothetical protein